MKECILVGNGKQDRKLGDTINSFEHVYRFNRFRVSGFEEYVGTRCTHWILNNALTTDSRNYYVNNIESIKHNHPEFIQTAVVTESDKSLSTLKSFKSKYEDFTYHIDKIRLGKNKMSTGALTIRYLTESYDVISLAGFDFGKSNHYWGNFGPSDVPGGHSWNEEELYVNGLVELNKVKII